jgi:uncharacterized protein
LKPRVVVDTNVLVSGIFFPNGNEARVLRLVLEDKVTLVASLETLAELRETLARPKFQLTGEISLALFQVILAKAKVQLEIRESEVKSRDKDDQIFLDLSNTVGADYLITGDPDILDIGHVGRTRIIRAPRHSKVDARTIGSSPTLIQRTPTTTRSTSKHQLGQRKDWTSTNNSSRSWPWTSCGKAWPVNR